MTKNAKRNTFIANMIVSLGITLIFMCLVRTNVFATSITTDTFKPLIELIYVVLKVAGAIVTLIGFARLVLSFANDQPDSRFSSAMQMIVGVALFFSDGILDTLGITL